MNTLTAVFWILIGSVIVLLCAAAVVWSVLSSPGFGPVDRVAVTVVAVCTVVLLLAALYGKPSRKTRK